MARRPIFFLLLVTLCAARETPRLSAHAGARLTDPVEGSTLGDTPTAITIAFTERPEASLSEIRVFDTRGGTHQLGRPTTVATDPMSLSVGVRALDRGVYIVEWRIVSAVDGHATSGAYAFGVRVPPTAVTTPSPARISGGSAIEMLARWLFVAGLVVLVGAAFASAAGFGSEHDLRLATAGWIAAAIGLALLAEAQRRAAGVPFADLARTSVGRALLQRALATAAAGAALLLAPRAHFRRLVMAVAACGAAAAMALHAAAGHAAAGDRWLVSPLAEITIQFAHFAAAGIWIGGLLALLVAVRGAESAVKTSAIRTFSTVAAIAIFVVTATGVVRAAAELTAPGDLLSSAYGRLVVLKILLLVALAVLGAANRWRSVPAAERTLQPLRRLATGELAFAFLALIAAAALGAQPPPASTLGAATGIVASGSDFGTTTRVQLTAPSDQPGPNRFVIRLEDYDSHRAIQADRATLMFAPLDDPGVDPTSLELTPTNDGGYAGSGANLAFAGRWRVTARIEHGGTSADVPLEIEARLPAQPVSPEHLDGSAPTYTVLVKRLGLIRFSPDPEGPGPSRLTITCWDLLGENRDIATLVVTVAGDGPARQVPVGRIDRNHFVADVDLRRGINRLAAIARTPDGTRIRAAFDLRIQ